MAEFSLTVDSTEVEKYMAKMTSQEIAKTSRKAMKESLGYLKTEVKKAMPVNTGGTKGRVFSEMRGTQFTQLKGMVASPDVHAVVLEKGRRPGAKMPPIDAIELWATRKLGVSGLGFVIARSIARKGTKPLHIFENAAKGGKGTVQRIWLQHFARIFE